MLNFFINLVNGEYGLFPTVLTVLVLTVVIGVVLALIGSAVQGLTMNMKGERKVKALAKEETKAKAKRDAEKARLDAIVTEAIVQCSFCDAAASVSREYDRNGLYAAYVEAQRFYQSVVCTSTPRWAQRETFELVQRLSELVAKTR